MITELKKKIRTHEYFIKGDERYFSEKDVKIAILEYRNILEHLDSQEILKEYDAIFGDFTDELP